MTTNRHPIQKNRVMLVFDLASTNLENPATAAPTPRNAHPGIGAMLFLFFGVFLLILFENTQKT